MSRITTAIALVAGVLLGALLTATRTGPVAPTNAQPPERPPQSETAPLPDAPGVLLTWSAPALPADIETRLASSPALGHSTIVTGSIIDLRATTDAAGHAVDTAPAGLHYPLDAIAIDTTTFPAFAPPEDASSIERLGDGQAILSSTGARLRRIGSGGILHVDGADLDVIGIVSDEAIGGAEIAITRGTAERLGLVTPRFLLTRHTTSRADTEDAIRRLLPPNTAIRLRAPGETAFLRDGDAVPPLAAIKDRFGEFAYRPGPDRDIIQDPVWVATHIVEADVPIIGTVRCHRELIEPLRAALADLETRNLAPLIDPNAYAGCWNPRRIRAEDPKLSHHAWGIAIDLNWGKNPTGLASVQDDRLVATLTAHGFTWGGTWLTPDPAHFEYGR